MAKVNVKVEVVEECEWKTWDNFVKGDIIEMLSTADQALDVANLRMVTDDGLLKLDTGNFIGTKVLEGIASPFYYRKLSPGVTVILSNE
jgi:hypothetical protein